MDKIKYICISFLLITSCGKSDDNISTESETLATYIDGKIFETGAVIACVASDIDSNDILTYYYPEPGTSNVRYYETENDELDGQDFLNYKMVDLESTPLFNGYLGQFTQNSTQEKWIVITFELEGEIKISNPIRTKQITKPSVWHNAISIDQAQTGMPVFSWEANAFGDNAIYFHVVSDIENNLLSGTYTIENQFQYYKTSNLVLNITRETPPDLILRNTYNITLMDVSKDNWVNAVVFNKKFNTQ